MSPALWPFQTSRLCHGPSEALLTFLASALPGNHPELRSVVEEHASNMVIVTPETHHSTLNEFEQCAWAVSEVKSRLRRVQVPSESGVHLELVHRFEVAMEQLERNDRDSVASTSHRERRRLGERPLIPLPVATEVRGGLGAPDL
ncbi:hypothetical protein PAXINDRAFT_166767, partial [Paxillus involutus ATCC 200175]